MFDINKPYIYTATYKLYIRHIYIYIVRKFCRGNKVIERDRGRERERERFRHWLSSPKIYVSVFFFLLFNFHLVCVCVICLWQWQWHVWSEFSRCRWFRFHLIPLHSKLMYIFFSNFSKIVVEILLLLLPLLLRYLHICCFTIICIRLSMENKYFSMNGKWSEASVRGAEM